MIASPGDVAVERDIVTQELYRWNAANAVSRKLILHPVRWETHSSPQMGAPPQNILNERLVLDADIVVGIFGTRIGTATQTSLAAVSKRLRPKFRVNSTVFFQIWLKIQHSSLKCLQQSIDFHQCNFSPPGVLVHERDGVSRPPAFGGAASSRTEGLVDFGDE